MWGNEVQSWVLCLKLSSSMFVETGWIFLSQLGCHRSAKPRIDLTVQPFVLNKWCSHRYAELLWSLGQLNHPKVIPGLHLWGSKHICLQKNSNDSKLGLQNFNHLFYLNYWGEITSQSDNFAQKASKIYKCLLYHPKDWSFRAYV